TASRLAIFPGAGARSCDRQEFCLNSYIRTEADYRHSKVRRRVGSLGALMTADGNDSVCVCIAAYNAEDTIARAVDSALRQSHVTEVIVVDDASMDGTVAIARQCDDGSGRLSVIVLERNGGPSGARNRALA